MIYKSIAERLRIRLNSADFTLNSLLPGEKKLAEEFAVSRMTIRKAIDLLVAWGLVVRRHGSGTYLVRKDVLHQTASLTGLVEVLKRQGKTVTSQVLIFEIMPAPPAIASQLRIQINEQIDLRGINLQEFLLRMFTPTLRWNSSYRTFDQFQQCLLYAFTGNVSGNGRVV